VIVVRIVFSKGEHHPLFQRWRSRTLDRTFALSVD